MQSKTLRFMKGFRIAYDNRRGQAAEMVIPADDSEGSPDNAIEVPINGSSYSAAKAWRSSKEKTSGTESRLITSH
jgi:hypothetical protein